MGGDIAGWSARQKDASYDERDQISIFIVHTNSIAAILQLYSVKTKKNEDKICLIL